VEEIIRSIKDVMKFNFWGTITIKFQNGKPVLIEKNESRKI
jgi:hypothetical protein